MQTASEIIRALGGPAAIARGINAPIGTVSAWGTRNSIPPEYWLDLNAYATASGRAETVNYDVLARHAARRRPSDRQEAA